MPVGLVQQPDVRIHPPIANDRLLHVDDTTFRSHFEHEPFLIDHALSDHPLFELSRLVQLSKTLPEKSIEYNAGTLPVNHPDMELTPRTGLSAEETIKRIENCKSWMVLKNVEHDPEYLRLMARCLDEIQPMMDVVSANIIRREGFIFISSPGSVTPYHMDPEYNFLLQVRGQKTVHQFDVRDRSIVTEEDLEDFYCREARNTTFIEAIQQKAQTFELTGGRGLYFPPTNPHWVQNGPDVSISFSVTWFTPSLDRRGDVFKVNSFLRQWGIRPTPVGVSSFRDGMKHRSFRVWRRMRRFFRRTAE